MSLSYRNQSIDLLWKSIDWFLYERETLVVKGLNLPMLVAPCSYNKILNNIAENSIEIAEESIDKTSRNFISMCRSDDENNEIYPESYKSDMKNACSNN